MCKDSYPSLVTMETCLLFSHLAFCFCMGYWSNGLSGVQIQRFSTFIFAVSLYIHINVGYFGLYISMQKNCAHTAYTNLQKIYGKFHQ